MADVPYAYINDAGRLLLLQLDGKEYDIVSKEQFLQILSEYGTGVVMNSSSIDFPDEFTDDEEVVKLVKEIFWN